MIYSVLKPLIRVALKIFCRKLVVRNREGMRVPGPLLITANHPNSFLDAIIIGSVWNRPVHFLARGDAFQKPWQAKLLGVLNMIPVYRMTDGREKLSLNDHAFRKCAEILRSNGVVLIFIEGISVHTHTLQPFKKGAARIAVENKHLPGFQVIPVGIAYHSFTLFGKEIHINIKHPQKMIALLPFEEDSKNFLHFNKIIETELLNAVDAPEKIKTLRTAKGLLLLVPGILGKIVNAPFYYPLRKVVDKKTSGTVFYDSVLFGTLFLLYPLYILIICPIAFAFSHSWFCATGFLLFPALAWCAVRSKTV